MRVLLKIHFIILAILFITKSTLAKPACAVCTPPVAPSHILGIPENIFGSFQGNAKLFADTIKTEAILILAAIITLYIVLGVLYESLIHPLTILSTLPPAGLSSLSCSAARNSRS